MEKKEKNKRFMFCTSWKMNMGVPEGMEYARKLTGFIGSGVKNIDRLEIFIFPDFLSLYPVSEIARGTGLKFGAQDCFWEDKGAFTGEVSPQFLKNLGCSYVIIGHPERTIQLKEDDRMINMKIKAVLKNKMEPLLLVFQKKEYTNQGQAFKIIRKELLSKTEGIDPSAINRIIIVFEPLWAIGAEKAAPVEYIQDSLIFLRGFFKDTFSEEVSNNQTIFYGGSVKLDNARKILKVCGNDGISSGRGAMDPEYFIEMIKIAAEVSKQLKYKNNL